MSPRNSNRDHQTISDTELDVLKVLWKFGPCPVREVHERLGRKRKSWAYNTVQTLVQRLVQKGFVTANKETRAHLFTATVTREQLLRDELGDLAQRVCDGATAPLAIGLVEHGHFSAAEIERLRELVERRAKKTPSRGRKKGEA